MATPKTVTGLLQGSDGLPRAGVVTITLSQPTTIPGTAEVLAAPITIAVPASGVYSASLYANADLTPAGTYYALKGITNDGAIENLTISVPQTAGPFVVSNITTSTPTASPTPNHVSTLVVDGAATFTNGPMAFPPASIADSALQADVLIGQKFMHLPRGWDDAWKAAKAAQATTPCWITLTGDSVAHGIAATSSIANTLMGVIRTAILARSGVTLYADYWSTAYNPTLWALATARLPIPTDFPFALGANGTPNAANRTSYGYTQLFAATGTPAGGFMSFTPPYNPSQIDVVVMDVFAGVNHTYNLDGGAGTTFNSANLDRQRRITFAGLTNAPHTVNWTQQSAVNSMQIAGCVAYPYPLPTTGIGFCRNAWSGGAMADLGVQNAASGVPVDKIGKLYTNQKFDGTQGFGIPMGAALNIIMLGENDMNSPNVNCGPDVYRRHLGRLIQAMRRGYPNGSILLVASSIPDITISDFTTYAASQNPENWHHYRQAMLQTAIDMNCGFIDMQAKPNWSPTPVASGLMINDGDPHPNNAGQADIANTILTVI